MMQNSNIEWTDHTFNPWWGCMKVSEGCKNCYAETLDHRYYYSTPHWGPNSTRKPQTENYWKQPLKWNAEAKANRVQAKVFCASMADVFEGNSETLPHVRRLMQLVEDTPWLIWQLLTKRPENILDLIPSYWVKDGFPENVWIGTSVENQKAADERIPFLLKVPAVVRFLSCEPLLGPIDLNKYYFSTRDGRYPFPYLAEKHRTTWLHLIDWVIAGGESGHGARPMHPDWIRSLRDQCDATGTAFFFKQWGEYWPGEKGRLYRETSIDFTDGHQMVKVGKKAAGALLDGKEYKQFPQAKRPA